MMKKYIGTIAIGISLLTAVTLTLAKEDPPKKQIEKAEMLVPVVNVKQQLVQDVVTGHGTVQARWRTTLTSEVSGRVLNVSPLLLEGSSFKAGSDLIVIEDMPYRAALSKAISKLAVSMRQYREEQERSKVAAENWAASELQGAASELTLRKPQLKELKALVDADVIDVEKAKYDLAQTQVSAPYDGVVVERLVNPGDAVQLGTELALLYDSNELELSISLSQREFDRLIPNPIGEIVELLDDDGQPRWEGKIVRTDKKINEKNRWRNIYIEITDSEDVLPGQFMTAKLPGKVFHNAFILPEKLVSSDGTVWFVDSDSILQRFVANVLFHDNQHAAVVMPDEISSPLSATTNRAIYLPGTKVKPVLDKEAGSLYSTLLLSQVP